MRHIAKTFAGLALLLTCVSCASQGRIDEREDELLSAWREAHPGQEPTPADREEIRKEAEKQVEGEAAREREEAIRKGSEIGVSLSRGDIFGAIMGAIGLAGLGFSALRTRKKETA